MPWHSGPSGRSTEPGRPLFTRLCRVVPLVVSLCGALSAITGTSANEDLTTAHLAGQVEVRGSREPIALALIGIYPLAPGTMDPITAELAEVPVAMTHSAADGRFGPLELAPGPYIVVVSQAGYRRERFVEELAPRADREVIYRLRPTGVPQTVVTVRADRDNPERILTRDDLRTAGAGRDPMAAVESLPGVIHASVAGPQRSPTAAPVLRGSAPEDSVLYLDGLPTPMLFHALSSLAIVDDGLVGRVSLHPAAANTRYGDLIGGLVGIDLRSPRADRIGGYLDLGVGVSAFSVEGPIAPRSRFYVGIRRSYYDLLMTATQPGDSPLDLRTAPFFQDQQILLETDPAAWLRLSLGYLGALDGLRLANPVEIEPGFETTTDLHRLQLILEMTAPTGLTNRLHPAISLWGYRFHRLHEFDTEDRHTTFHIADELHIPVAPWLDVDAGGLLEVDKLDQRRDLPWPEPEETGPDTAIGQGYEGTQRRTRTWLGAWVEAPFRPAKPLVLTPGFRIDHFADLARTVPQPRTSIGVEPIPQLRISLAGGRYAQAPSDDERSEILGNPSLGPELGWHLNAGIWAAPVTGLRLDLQGYVKWLDELAVSDQAAAPFALPDEWQHLWTDAGDDPTHGLENTGRGRIYGGEAFIRFDLVRRLRLSGWIGYGLSWSRRQDADGEDWQWFEHDRRHQLSAVLQLHFPGEFCLGTRWQLQSGAPDTPIERWVHWVDDGNAYPVFGAFQSTRTIPYHQLDIRIDKMLRARKHTVDVYVEVLNVYATPAAELEFLATIYKGLEITSLPTINLGARVEF